ncbi:ImpA family type VI secretion system protein [Siccibacter turicensis]|uniref:ImpA N-terminal domain-containing protein n=1 Tax=Siccibacter turicensis TaxID=357233 RepID=A0A2P8VMU9_9ENTR|nr:type VI secretion system ImpA family N-terminal domain-containing protein [Siccibacter turicensis]PSN08740.1 hypothetical protein C7G83_05115 [Siccibacter turicensis]
MVSNQNANLSPFYQTIVDGVIDQGPCGVSLEYDPGFLLLQGRLQPKMGAEYGDFVEAAEPINWGEVERDCRTLLQKSLDVRLIITLARCRIRQHGAVELAAGLAALIHVLVTWPDDLHPQLIDEGEFEPLMRANAFSELTDSDGFLADVRHLLLPNALGLTVTIKDYEKSFSVPRDENALSEAAITALHHEWCEHPSSSITALGTANALVAQLSQLLSSQLGDSAPDLDRLAAVLRLFDFDNEPCTTPSEQPLQEIATLPAEPESGCNEMKDTRSEQMPTVVNTPVMRRRAVINNRDDALESLKDVRAWFSRMEPGSPVILLLQFAEKMMGKSFGELLRCMPMDMVSQLENNKE